jgi:glutathione S-transferase
MNQFTLYTSLRSPFGRRIRLILEQLKKDNYLNFNIEWIDVFSPPKGFHQINPLQRVPVLLDNRSRVPLADSNQIYSFLEEQYFDHPLFLHEGISKMAARNLLGVTLGTIELLVSGFLESQKTTPDQSYIEEYKQNIERALKFIENTLNQSASFTIISSRKIPNVIDLHLLCLYDYSNLRMPTLDLKRFRNFSVFCQELTTKFSFLKE